MRILSLHGMAYLSFGSEKESQAGIATFTKEDSAVRFHRTACISLDWKVVRLVRQGKCLPLSQSSLEMEKVCRNCGEIILPGSKVCPHCGKGRSSFQSSSSSFEELTQNIAGVLCYITLAPALFFLFLEPYRSNKFIRFHAFQSIILWITLAILMLVFGIFSGLSAAAQLLLIPIEYAVLILFFALIAACAAKAYSREKLKLPLISQFAEDLASR